MRYVKDLMKVSAVGVILLSALAACNGKPESNPTPPESDQVEVIIEQVVDGKVVDTRAVGRTDVVKHVEGMTDGKDVAQIGWPDDVSSDRAFDFTYYAKPGLYLEAGGYRFNQTEDPRMTTFGFDTYGQTEAIKKVGKVTCYPEGHKKIYVRLEYKNVNNPSVKSDYDYVLDVETGADYVEYRDYWSIGRGRLPQETTNFHCSGYRVHHRFTFTSLKTKPKDFREIELGLWFNTKNNMRPREIHKIRKGGQWDEEWQYQTASDEIVFAMPYNFILDKKVMGLSIGGVVSFDCVFGFDSGGTGGTAPLSVQYDDESVDRHKAKQLLREFTDYGLRFNYKNDPTDSDPIIQRISYAKTSTNAKIYINPRACVKSHGHYTLDTTPSN